MSVPAHHTTLALQGVVVGLHDFALLDDEFVLLGFFGVGVGLLSFDLAFNDKFGFFLDFELVVFLCRLDCLDQRAGFVRHRKFVAF